MVCVRDLDFHGYFRLELGLRAKCFHVVEGLRVGPSESLRVTV